MKPEPTDKQGEDSAHQPDRIEALIDGMARDFASSVSDSDAADEAYNYGRAAAIAAYLFPDIPEGMEIELDNLPDPFTWESFAKSIQELADRVSTDLGHRVRLQLRHFSRYHNRRPEVTGGEDPVDLFKDGVLAGWHLRSAYDAVAAHASLFRASRMNPKRAGLASGKKRRGHGKNEELKEVIRKAWSDYQRVESKPSKSSFVNEWLTTQPRLKEYGLAWADLRSGTNASDEGLNLEGEEGFGVSLETIRSSWLS